MSTEAGDRDGYPLAGESRAQTLTRGENLGRFVVLRHLGAGRMGSVVSAYDPERDRNVAIKLLRPDRLGADSASLISERLLEAGHAMAEISHPNVVPIVEVDVLGEQVFIAMEQVQGQTLTGWLREKRRSWRDIVATMVQAGEGLAAAHRAGVLHRDFKPENVLVDKDGRVYVTDFGLLSTEGAVADPESMQLVQGTPFPLATSLCANGVMLGTPRYMAPEQHRQEKVDGRSDQFAFCVCLYEALYGQHPFAGDSYWELASNVMRGDIRDAEAEEHVPTWLWWAVRRGLNSDPDDRFPYMESLLRELRTGIERVPAFGAEAAEKLTGVWDDTAKERVEEAFLESGRPYAEDTFARVERILDQYAEHWVAAHAEACEATHVMHEQSEEVLALQLHCLDRHRNRLATLAEIFSGEADGDVVDNAVEMALSLEAPAGCRKGDGPVAAIPPPEDPKLRDRVEYLRRRLAHAELRQRAGKAGTGLRIVEEVSMETENLDYPPVRAEALMALGTLLNDSDASSAADATFNEALEVAAKAKDDAGVARCWSHLLYTRGCQLGHPEDALALRRTAEIAAIRADDPLITSLVLGHLAAVYSAAGELDRSRRCYEKAITVKKDVVGNDHPDIARWYGQLGGVLHREGHLEQSRRCLDAARAIFQRRLGRHHPEVAASWHRLAQLAKELGNLDEALDLCSRAISIVERVGGSWSRVLPDYLLCEGEVRLAMKQTSEAQAPLERALGLREGQPDADCARIRFCLARALWESEEDKRRAVELAKRSLAGYSDAGAGDAKARAEVLRWLKGRGIGK